MDATVPAWQWVYPISSADGYSSGHTCAIDFGGQLTEIGRSGELVLARYSQAGRGFHGAECEKGQIFFIPASDFDTMNGRYDKRREQEDAKASLARNLLQKERDK